jgi:outer membrane protein insertion porin family
MRFLNTILLVLSAILVPTLHADAGDRFISSIEFKGLDRVDEQRVQNLIQATVGEPYIPEIVQGDVHILTHLGEFKYIYADVILQEDDTIALLYRFTEQQIITQVSVVGNTMMSDKELLFATPIMQGLGRNEDAIDRGKRAIMDLYTEQGNYLVEVFPEIIVYGKDIDEFTGIEIDESVVLIYKIMEGPRVRVKGMSFYGNHSFSDKELSSEIDTNVSVPFFRRGELNEQVLAADVSSLKRFYINRGFRDVRVSYADPLSPNDKEASVIFLIEEGPQYTIGGISAEFTSVGNLQSVFTEEQIRGLIPMKQGSVFRQTDVNKSVAAINSAYGVLGRIINIDPKQQAIKRARNNMFGSGNTLELDAAVAVPYHAEPGATVDIVFVITEGLPTKVGIVDIKGNSVTQDKVIRGRIGLKPGYPFNVEEAARSEDRLMKTGLFNKVTMTIQPEDKKNPNIRDLLVELDERQTGSLNFGLMAGSDSGLVGNISLTQQNFDIADWPESWEEFWQRKAFIGAGQQFTMAFQPGDEVFNYEIGLTDPRFLDTDYSLGGNAGWSRRDYTDYTQDTLYSQVNLGRRFGDIWYGSVSLTANQIKLTDIDNNVPQEIFNDRGPNTINSIGFNVTRNTLKPFNRPNEGSRARVTINQFGMPSGDYTFTKTSFAYTTYFALDKDFLNRASTLRLDCRIGHIFGGTAPTFEKFYLGGRTFRGFNYRSISPLGTPRVAGGDPNVAIGGDWEFFLGAQYEFPVVDRFISMVFFCDSGTVENTPGFDDYRVSVGTGIRMHIPQLGQAPLAFDFGFPIVKLDTDKKRTFSFSVQLPF